MIASLRWRSVAPAALSVSALLNCASLTHAQELIVSPDSTPESFYFAWPATPGAIYQIQKSSELVTWEPVSAGYRTGTAGEAVLDFEYSGVPDVPVINVIETALVESGTIASFLIPQDGSLGSTWTQPEFDASAWSTAALGIGYDTAGSNNYDDLFGHDSTTESGIQRAMRGANTVPTMFIRAEFEVDDPIDELLLIMQIDDGFIAYLNGVPVANLATPEPTEWNSTATESSDEDLARGEGITFDLTGQISALVEGRNVLAIHGLNKSTGDSDFLMLPTLIATRFEEEVEETIYLRVVELPAASDPRLAITEFMASNDDNMLDEDGDSPDWIEITNSGSEFASLRDWFLTDNANELNKWKFPDVVVAPGEQILVFASGKDRTDLRRDLHTNFQLSSAGEYLALVQPDGSTIVSAFGSATTPFSPQFADISYGTTLTGDISGYFLTPTPLETNAAEVVNSGPIVSMVTLTPDHGRADQDIVVTASVAENTAPVSNVDLVYRVMFGEEKTVAMTGDGAGGFSATIPADDFAEGEMVRYYVDALDSDDRRSRKPEYFKPTASAAYLGTVIQDSDLPDTKLPVLEWFVEDPRWHKEGSGNNRDWAFVSVFYGGQFYDNVRVRTRGGVTQRLPKPNFKFDFYNGGHFTYAPDQRAVEEFNLQSFAGEIWTPAYMRNPLGYKTYQQAGMPGPFSFYVHVRQNGEFYGLSAIEEQIDERFLRRHGMNDRGALYKAHLDAWLETERSQSKWEADWFKRIPEDVDYSDIAAFTEGLSLEDPAEREAFLFDNVNIPRVIHYLAITILGPNHDRLQHNYYVHRDTGNTDEWSFLPWDLDRWFPQGSQLSNATMRSIFYGDSDHERADSGVRNQYNRLNDAIFDVPRTREMYVHHVRKVIDELTLNSTFFEDSIDEFAALIELDADLDNRKWRLGRLSTGVSALKSTIRTRRRQLDRDSNIPPADESAPQLAFGAIEPGQYIEIVNQRETAINISGWELQGAVEFTFKHGTVIPGTSHAPNNVIYVSPNVRAFRHRTMSPKGGEGHFVQGDYVGDLAPSGATVELVDSNQRVIAEFTR